MIELKNLSDLLIEYFKNDNSIEIEYINHNNRIQIDINERYYHRELNIIHSHSFNNELFISINEFIYDEKSEDEELKDIEIFNINSILYELNENKFNLIIIYFIQSYLDIIE